MMHEEEEEYWLEEEGRRGQICAITLTFYQGDFGRVGTWAKTLENVSFLNRLGLPDLFA